MRLPLRIPYYPQGRGHIHAGGAPRVNGLLWTAGYLKGAEEWYASLDHLSPLLDSLFWKYSALHPTAVEDECEHHELPLSPFVCAGSDDTASSS